MRPLRCQWGGGLRTREHEAARLSVDSEDEFESNMGGLSSELGAGEICFRSPVQVSFA